MELTNPELSIWKVIGEFLEKLTYYVSENSSKVKGRI
jgi:hypothetical protein